MSDGHVCAQSTSNNTSPHRSRVGAPQPEGSVVCEGGTAEPPLMHVVPLQARTITTDDCTCDEVPACR